jgi:hypothetical protein
VSQERQSPSQWTRSTCQGCGRACQDRRNCSAQGKVRRRTISRRCAGSLACSSRDPTMTGTLTLFGHLLPSGMHCNLGESTYFRAGGYRGVSEGEGFPQVMSIPEVVYVVHEGSSDECALAMARTGSYVISDERSWHVTMLSIRLLFRWFLGTTWPGSPELNKKSTCLHAYSS